MLGERLRDCKDEAARPKSCRLRAGTRGERLVEIGQAVRSRSRCWPCATASSAASRSVPRSSLASDAAKLDDLGTDRERRHQLRALQRLRLIRQRREPAIHAALPIVGRPRDRTRREAAQIAQRQRQQPAGPKCGRQRRQQAKRQAPRRRPLRRSPVRSCRIARCRSSSGWRARAAARNSPPWR